MATGAKEVKVQVPSARIISVPSPIERFKGRLSNRSLISHSGPTVTRWFEQLENYFVTEHIVNDDLKISEAKRYIDVTQGDAREVITLPHIRIITTWSEFKKALFALYRSKTEENPFVAWEEFTSLTWKAGDNLLSYLTQAEDLADKVARSFQVHFDVEFPETPLKLTIWSNIYKKMNHSKQEVIFSKIKMNQDVTKQVIAHMKDELTKPSASLIKLIGDNAPTQKITSSRDRTSSHNRPRFNNELNADNSAGWTMTGNKERNEQLQMSEWSTLKEQKRCFKCKKLGHIARYCRNQGNQFFRVGNRN